MENITESHKWAQCKSQYMMPSPAMVDISTSQLLHLWLRECLRGEHIKILRIRTTGNLLWSSLSWKWLNKWYQNKVNINEYSHMNGRKFHLALDKELQATNDVLWLIKENGVYFTFKASTAIRICCELVFWETFEGCLYHLIALSGDEMGKCRIFVPS